MRNAGRAPYYGPVATTVRVEGGAMADISEAAQGVRRILDENPAYRFLYASVIAFCEDERTMEEALAFCESARVSASQILSASAMVDVLVGCDALRAQVLVDGLPYEGTLEEAQSDDRLSDDATVEVRLRATDAGREAVEAQAAGRSLEGLFAQNPTRQEAFRAVLAWCAGEGKTTRQLQELLREADLLETEQARGIDGLHASYFTGALESVGALVWNGKAWVAA